MKEFIEKAKDRIAKASNLELEVCFLLVFMLVMAGLKSL